MMDSQQNSPPHCTADWLAQARAGFGQLQGRVAEAAKAWRPPDLSKVGVNVQVDMLGPAVANIKQQYAALPEPVRQLLPYGATSLVTCAMVARLHAEQLSAVTARYGHLRADHDQLTAQAAQLEAQLSEVNMKR